MVGDGKEAFWFPLAAGTIGGLVMSILGIFFVFAYILIEETKKIIKVLLFFFNRSVYFCCYKKTFE